MNLKTICQQNKDEGEVLAYFGGARLVKKLDGRLELVGGDRGDRTAAREWISMFFHEAVVREGPLSHAAR